MTFEHIGTPRVCLTVNPPSGEVTEKTVIIAGIPRGGTTMVAAAVEALGVYLGPEEDLRNFHFEDQIMNRPYLNEQHDCIKQRDAEHSVWGWKDPGAIHPLVELAHAVRNPRVIIVFRDMLASIQGEMRFDEVHGISRPFNNLIDSTMNAYDKNWSFIKRTKLPTLLVSYERAVRERNAFLDEVISFLQIDPTPEQRTKALDRISPDGGYYIW